MYAWMVGKLIRFIYREAAAGRPRIVTALASPDVELHFPGANSFAGSFRGKTELRQWLARFGSASPTFTIHDVLVSGPPWNMRVALRFSDAIGEHYRNQGMEYLRLRRGRVSRIEVFLDTETISAWERGHPEAVPAPLGRAA